MRLLVCGSRSWSDEVQLWRCLDAIHAQRPVNVLIHGAARGADRMAARWAESHGIETLAFPADWKRDGRRGGPLRNQRMLDEGRPDFGVAFRVPAFQPSKGTDDMYRRLRSAGVPCDVVYAP